MNSSKLCSLFKDYRIAVESIQKIFLRDAHLHITTGTRRVAAARKYRRPEDVEDPNYYGVGPRKEIKSLLQSLEARGFAKEEAPYNPPEDVDKQLQNICKKVFGPDLKVSWTEQALNEPLLKYKVLTKCNESFKKDVPNSFLHKMKTVGDLLEFYRRPVQGCYHYEAMLRDSAKLPPNMYLLRDTPDFDPDKDTFFDGVTAFPGRRRIIHTKYGEKYEKIIQWPNI